MITLKQRAKVIRQLCAALRRDLQRTSDRHDFPWLLGSGVLALLPALVACTVRLHAGVWPLPSWAILASGAVGTVLMVVGALRGEVE